MKVHLQLGLQRRDEEIAGLDREVLGYGKALTATLLLTLRAIPEVLEEPLERSLQVAIKAYRLPNNQKCLLVFDA